MAILPTPHQFHIKGFSSGNFCQFNFPPSFKPHVVGGVDSGKLRALKKNTVEEHMKALQIAYNPELILSLLSVEQG